MSRSMHMAHFPGMKTQWRSQIGDHKKPPNSYKATLSPHAWIYAQFD